MFQSSEVANSNACELEGLERSMAFLAESGLAVDTVITDRHKSVAKYLREEHPAVKHYYDTWHVAKGNILSFLLHSRTSAVPFH